MKLYFFFDTAMIVVRNPSVAIVNVRHRSVLVPHFGPQVVRLSFQLGANLFQYQNDYQTLEERKKKEKITSL